MSKVLILGAGMIANPIINYLLNKNVSLTVATRNRASAIGMIANHPGGSAVEWDTADEAALDKMVSEHEITVSLLPWQYHPQVARFCLRHKRHLVTTSYVKPEMTELDEPARDAGIILLNELGLDPGIDHMSAMRIIDGVHRRGGKIEGFYSMCGALPSPDAAGNPFRYKFSWSPKGVIMAGNNEAQFLRDSEIIKVASEDLFKNPMQAGFHGGGSDPANVPLVLEVYPNRDSLPYIDLYGIQETRTMIRGTFRYPGWCGILDTMKRLGLLSDEIRDFSGKTFAGFMALMIGESGSGDIRKKVASWLGTDPSSHALSAMEWLGLFNGSPMNRGMDTPFEIVSDLMTEKMELGPDERDMVALQHILLVSWPGGEREVIKSSLVQCGSPSTDTAVARTVALPAAMAVEMILEGQITARGVHIPVIPEIYNPVLDRLEDLGMKMNEQYGLPDSDWPEGGRNREEEIPGKTSYDQ
jgi:saccharopine dehydrogenase-like NADP-dependent oxidoreductase